MGQKGDKLTQGSVLVAKEIVDKLEPMGGISSKKMFGGHGIFHEGKMFGIVDSKGMAYLKVDDSLKLSFEEKGAIQHGKMPYFSIPGDIIDDNSELLKWVRKSIKISK